MTAPTFAERYRQARLYAAQVRTRKAMGDKYEHAKPGRGLKKIRINNCRRIAIV